MLADVIDVMQRGDSSGNNMIVRIRLSSGRQIYGFATENLYGGDWDIGPTWNYLVTGKNPFLVDSGRRGKGLQLGKMIEFAGFNGQDIAAVIVSHGHEDHDGGLFELTNLINTPVVAHEVYSHLVRPNAKSAPSKERADFPASCWCCPMPETFYKKNCLEYHIERQELNIVAIGDFREELGAGIEVTHAPGHCPDSVVIVVDGEAILVGDTILPEITPHPTLEGSFTVMKPALPEKFDEAQQLFGLRAYIRSLKKLSAMTESTDRLLVLPSHRLYYQDTWNQLDLHGRIDELVQHHVDRCHEILRILNSGPKTPKEIARDYFDPDLLKGYGINLAINEIKSHCELMEISQDVVVLEGDKMLSTGGENFRSLIIDL
ncbi:MAG: MBL fold metallo-hydrolase [Desulfomonile tiedjei]|uniref:MBL fold metallo-hydrolase n=1 Tax=Desulfomonile tiedjei TaxID=2358 RepID=A0A9D6UY56_9BACT|nr:MBL fold metallo-hydrolase [Desulfomonile tiedjei]